MSYEDEFYDDDGFLDPTDGTTIIQVLRGDYGPEARAEALDMAEIELNDGPDEPAGMSDAEYQDAWAKETQTQMARIEQERGAPLSFREKEALMNDHGGSDQVPNIRESYDNVIGRSMRNKDDRQAIGQEIYEEHEAAMGGEYSSEHSLERTE
jgi:hypothetical protein